MRDLLVRYLLGELNSQEQEQLEAELRDSPELRRELAYLRSCMPGGGDDDLDRPQTGVAPSGLAERTLDRICGDGPSGEMSRDAATVAAAYDPPAGSPSWSLADLTVAGGVFLAISMLFLPALRQSRDAARRTGCEDNLRQFSVIFEYYSDQHGGYFPTVAANGKRGHLCRLFARRTVRDRRRVDTAVAVPVVATGGRRGPEPRHHSRADDVGAMLPQRVGNAKLWKQLMGGSYAYQIGYYEGDRYHGAIRNERSCHKAVLADAPVKESGNLHSSNHGGCGANVLYQSGCVRFQTDATLAEVSQDSIYVNAKGEEAAGLGHDDTVLGRSEVTPDKLPPETTP